MKLEEALRSPKPLSALADDPTTVYHAGAVEQDGHSDYIRLYVQPQNPFKYLRIKKTDVVGELTEISEEALRESGLISKAGVHASRAVKVFHVSLRRGADAEVVQISMATLGKQYPPGFLRPIRRPAGPMPTSASPGQQTHGCSCGGSTGAQPTGPADTYYGYCTFCGACRSGCCWCNDFTGCTCDNCSC